MLIGNRRVETDVYRALPVDLTAGTAAHWANLSLLRERNHSTDRHVALRRQLMGEKQTVATPWPIDSNPCKPGTVP